MHSGLSKALELAAGMFRGWPRDVPLAALWEMPTHATGGNTGSLDRPGRVMLGAPRQTFRVEAFPAPAGARPRLMTRWLESASGVELSPPIEVSGVIAADLDRLLAWGRGQSAAVGVRGSGWLGCFSYDLGRWLEPAVERGRRQTAALDRPWPLVELHRIDSGVEIDLLTGEARAFGARGASLMCDDGRPRRSHTAPFICGTGQREFEAAAARAIEYIRAGDVFQVNLARRMTAAFSGSAREAFLSLAREAMPRHGAYLELARGRQAGALRGAGALLSVSPELFLEVDEPSRCIRVQPMKGTRPGDAAAGELEQSGKDRAELNMIIDLMRNDLGRVAALGSVHVERARLIERHAAAADLAVEGAQPGVWQASGVVAAQLRRGATWGSILTAAFPPGSVTGAPKIRAMQIIDELEPVRRGPYCGAIGWIGDNGSGRLNVAIRTALVSGPRIEGDFGYFENGLMDYSVGAGIVADSEPAAEWHETIVKSGVLAALRSK